MFSLDRRVALPTEVAALADEVIVLDAGHLAARGAPVDVLRDGTPAPAR